MASRSALSSCRYSPERDVHYSPSRCCKLTIAPKGEAPRRSQAARIRASCRNAALIGVDLSLSRASLEHWPSAIFLPRDEVDATKVARGFESHPLRQRVFSFRDSLFSA